MKLPTSVGADLRRHELLSDLAEQAARRLMEKHGISEEAAGDIGNELADFIADHWSGQDLYFPSDQSFRLNTRDWEIFRRMERGYAPDLAREYGISTVRIYQIYKRCLVAYRALTQHSLFAGENGSADQA
jgi:Mor family transcriptional regulator